MGKEVKQPIIVVFDSGLGGVTVYRQIKDVLPEAQYIYVADNEAFPYGAWEEGALSLRILDVMAGIIQAYNPDLIVIACNTASTIALSALRQKFSIPFVGTVPAIKVAAARSSSKVFSVLATQGTVKREYTHSLVREFAQNCHVTLIGARALAQVAEQKMRGETVDLKSLREMIAPCFIEHEGKKTDFIVLACTHFPLLRVELEQAALWSVRFIDPAPAIARQVLSLVQKLEGRGQGQGVQGEGRGEGGLMLFTQKKEIEPSLQEFLNLEGLGQVSFL